MKEKSVVTVNFFVASIFIASIFSLSLTVFKLKLTENLRNSTVGPNHVRVIFNRRKKKNLRESLTLAGWIVMNYSLSKTISINIQ
jgi:hypothetical protein